MASAFWTQRMSSGRRVTRQMSSGRCVQWHLHSRRGMSEHLPTRCRVSRQITSGCRVSRQMSSRRRVPRHLPSGQGVPGHLPSGRGVSEHLPSGCSACLTDAECQGKWDPDGAYNGAPNIGNRAVMVVAYTTVRAWYIAAKTIKHPFGFRHCDSNQFY